MGQKWSIVDGIVRLSSIKCSRGEKVFVAKNKHVTRESEAYHELQSYEESKNISNAFSSNFYVRFYASSLCGRWILQRNQAVWQG